MKWVRFILTVCLGYVILTAAWLYKFVSSYKLPEWATNQFPPNRLGLGGPTPTQIRAAAIAWGWEMFGLPMVLSFLALTLLFGVLAVHSTWRKS